MQPNGWLALRYDRNAALWPISAIMQCSQAPFDPLPPLCKISRSSYPPPPMPPGLNELRKMIRKMSISGYQSESNENQKPPIAT